MIMEWQPIETAPKGEITDYRDRVVLVWARGKPVRMAFYTNAWRLAYSRGTSLMFDPTHWMPLPEPPKTESTGE